MMFAPSWRVNNILKSNANLKVKTAPVPQIPISEDETTNVNWGSFWVEAVSKTAEDQAVAWDFLKFMIEKEQMVKMFTIASNNRIFGEPYSRQDLYPTLSSELYLAPYVKAANTATSWYMCDNTHDNVFNDKIIDIFAAAVDKVNAGGNSETAIREAAKEVNKVITEATVKKGK